MLLKRCLYSIYALIFLLFVLAFLEYPGQGYIYILFTIVSNTLLYFGFRRNAIFFDTFIGVFFWLGFWLKLTIRVAFMDGKFHNAVGNFDGSGLAFDQALLVTSCGLVGLLAFSIIREKFIFTYPKKPDGIPDVGLFKFYENHRKLVLLGFVILFVSVAITNFYYGIYQRGAIPRTVLPYGLGGVYKWLLLFGLASVSALILRFEFMLNKKTTYPVVIFSLMESFFSNVSLLSRGMILNTGALFYGVIKNLKLDSIKSSARFLAISFSIFVILFGSSLVAVNYIRSGENKNLDAITTHHLFFIDRWVGIEGVMAVSSYPEQGWDLWNQGWQETYSDNKTSFYNLNLITTPYLKIDKTKYHYVSLPGILAFCFYPDSFPFLFVCMFLLGGIAAAIEISVFKLGGKNVILCALLVQVVAYRYAHFGYVPRQSYLLFGALYLNLLLFYFSNKFLIYWENQKRG